MEHLSITTLFFITTVQQESNQKQMDNAQKAMKIFLWEKKYTEWILIFINFKQFPAQLS